MLTLSKVLVAQILLKLEKAMTVFILVEVEMMHVLGVVMISSMAAVNRSRKMKDLASNLGKKTTMVLPVIR